MSDYIIEMSDIKKNFGEVKAVKNGCFNLKKGEIHSIIGENGAGKSTMMKILYGMYHYDAGNVFIGGEKLHKYTTKDAIAKGIGMVHQEFMLVDELTVLENIILGFEPEKGLVIDFDKAKKNIQHYIEKYDMNVSLNKRINQISVGEAQRVEIIKVLSRGANIIILDEPTAVLTPQETERLFEILQNLKNMGNSIVFISHKLNEIMDISDRITVMRQGEYIGTVNKNDTNIPELAKMMVGREVFLDIDKVKTNIGKTVLEVKDLWTSGEKEMSKIRGLSLKVREGEILGVAGIDGNGQTELVEAITGLRKVEKGSVLLSGKDIKNLSVKDIRKKGIAHIPEDRNTRGLNKQFTIKNNLIAALLDEEPFSRKSILKKDIISEYARKLIEKFDIRPNNADAIASGLSGGNAQKIVVAREVSVGGNLLIASQPTRGVDIGAIESIHKILQEVKSNGLGVLLISADLEEIFALSDRIIVMREGRITGELDGNDVDKEKIGLMMMSSEIDH